MTRINTNIASMVGQFQLHRNERQLELHLRRLSTGLRINRGSDHPAGLIVSEKLRSEIATTAQAIQNCTRTINVMTTIEGALEEVSRLLLDGRGLITESASVDGLTDAELEANQLQLDSILDSIARIADTTTFAGENLLDGVRDYVLSGVRGSAIANVTVFGAGLVDDTAKRVNVSVTQSAQRAELAFAGAGLTASNSVTLKIEGAKGTETLRLTGSSTTAELATIINTATAITGVSATASAAGMQLLSTEFGVSQFVKVTPIEGTFIVVTDETAQDDGRDPNVIINGRMATTDGFKAFVRTADVDTTLYLTEEFATRASQTTSFHVIGGGSFFQLTPQISLPGRASIGVRSVRPGDLGNANEGFLDSLASNGANSLLSGRIDEAEEILKVAIDQVSVLRGRLGGFQRNTVEPSITSQGIALENITAAESAVRDADFALETSALTRSQILVQANIAALVIANSLPQATLTLLQ